MTVLRHHMCLVTGLMLALNAGCSNEQSTQPVTQNTLSDTEATSVRRPVAHEFEPCALISHADLEEIAGVSLSEPKATIDRLDTVTYLSCSSDDIHINIESWGDSSKAAASYDFSGKHPSIEGLGDKARNTQPLGEVDVLYGQFIVSVDLFTGQGRETELEVAQKIARVVLENLPE
ncbi:MAG: hypothetical protein AB2792_05770 [Candidatus Thiodiazotropha sp.]